MLSANNILSPASGRPIVTPQQDIIIGGYYLTATRKSVKGEGRVYRRPWEVFRALDEGIIDLHAQIKLLGVRDEDGQRSELRGERSNGAHGRCHWESRAIVVAGRAPK